MSFSQQPFAVKTTRVDFKTPLVENGKKSNSQIFETSFKKENQTEEELKNGPLPPLHISEQNFVLINVCHHNQKPRHTEPGFRVLGLFPSAKTAKNFLTLHEQDFELANVFLVPTHEPIPLCQDERDQQSQEYCLGTRQKLMQLYQEYMDKCDREFEHNRKKTSKQKEEEIAHDKELLGKQ